MNTIQIEHIRADKNWALYLQKRIEIVSIYNKNSQFHIEETHINKENLTKFELLHCFFIKDITGGVLIEQLYGNESYSLITFAGFNSDDRMKGYCKSIIKYAENTLKHYSTLIGVQMNDFDDETVWKKLEFTEKTALDSGYCLIKPHST